MFWDHATRRITYSIFYLIIFYNQILITDPDTDLFEGFIT